MNFFDIIIISIIGVSIVYSAFRGIIEEIFSLLSIIAGFFLASVSYIPISDFIYEKIIDKKPVATIVGFGVIFLAIVIGITLAGMVVKRLIHFARLGWLDRFGGACFGAVKGLLIVTVMVLVFTAFLPPKSPILKDSTLTPVIHEIADQAIKLAPGSLKEKYLDEKEKLIDSWKKGKKK